MTNDRKPRRTSYGVAIEQRGERTMELPYAEPLVPRPLAAPVIPEPPRRGEPGGEPCGVCPGEDGDQTIWSDENWILNHGVDTSLAGAVWLTTRVHVDTFSELPAPLAGDFGVLAARIDRALVSLPGVARTHMYRWGDGGAHFHVWFLPRPHGMLQARGMMLPLWEDVLPHAADQAIAEARRRIGASLSAQGPVRVG
jgi:diadenosine tetraphosphate (Ap4A) HIT family hydrolase